MIHRDRAKNGWLSAVLRTATFLLVVEMKRTSSGHGQIYRSFASDIGEYVCACDP